MAVDSLAEGKARKAGDPNRRPGRLPRLLDHSRDPGLLIDDKDLLEQDDFFIELAQAPIDHLINDSLGLPARARLLAQHSALALECRLRHQGGVEIKRAGR